MYKLIIRPILFWFDPEKVHYFSFDAIKFLSIIPGLSWLIKKMYIVDDERLAVNLFGLNFRNRVGLAAGFDKDAKLYKELADFGFGFIEIGTVTPQPQAGNDKPRLFRLKADEAIINRMGFNNGGVAEAVDRLKKPRKVIVGGNIGKNKNTPQELAANDYCSCFEALFDVVDYFAVNVSSPNTAGLRALQDRKPLTEILKAVQKLNNLKLSRKPILLKIAPDLTNGQLLEIIEIVKETKIDGIIATNTTISRDGLLSKNAAEIGGLSGKILSKRSTEVIRFLAQNSNHAFPIIGVGGIHSANDALEKLAAGASLVQLYTGFIYEGPKLVRDINNRILAEMN